MDSTCKNIIRLLSMLVLCDFAFSLRCMNCSSNSLSPVAGCHVDFSEEFITDCPFDSTHCQVLRYKGSIGESGVIEYERLCAIEFREECIAFDDDNYDGVMCAFSCHTDGCNAMNVFPNEPEYTTPALPVATTLEIRHKDLLQCYICSSNPFVSPDGCEEFMSDEYLMDCLSHESFCLTTRYGNDDVVVYNRTCGSVSMEGCVFTQEGGMLCHRSCDSDGCNAMTTFQSETINVIEGMEGRQKGPRRCYQCVSDALFPDGCKEFMSDEYLLDCFPQEYFCQVMKVDSNNGPTIFVRSCGSEEANGGCEETSDSKLVCTRSCDSDGCNNKELQFPELSYLKDSPSPVPEESTTSEATKQLVNLALTLICIGVAIKRLVWK